MNSSLEHEFVGFEFPKHTAIDVKDEQILLNFGEWMCVILRQFVLVTDLS